MFCVFVKTPLLKYFEIDKLTKRINISTGVYLIILTVNIWALSDLGLPCLGRSVPVGAVIMAPEKMEKF